MLGLIKKPHVRSPCERANELPEWLSSSAYERGQEAARVRVQVLGRGPLDERCLARLVNRAGGVNRLDEPERSRSCIEEKCIGKQPRRVDVDSEAAKRERRTGFRSVRGTHGGNYVRDPEGTDVLPAGAEPPPERQVAVGRR